MRSLLLSIMLLTCLWASARQKTATELYDDGLQARTNKNYTEAVDLFRKVIALDPSNGKAWYELGWCSNELKNYSDAATALEKARDLLGDQAKIFFELGYANQFLNNKETSRFNYQRCLQLNKEYSGAYRQLGHLYFEQFVAYDSSLKYLNEYISRTKEEDVTALAWYRKGYCEVEFGQYELGIVSLKKATVIDNKYLNAFNELGYAYYKLKKINEAVDAYRTAQYINPENSTAYTGLGDVYRILKKDPDAAFDQYRKAVEVNPKSANSLYGMGWYFNEKSRYDDAVIQLKKAIEINPKSSQFYTELGYSYYGQKKYYDAISTFDQSLAIRESSLALYYKGLALIELNDKTKAQEVQRKLQPISADLATKLQTKINAL